MCTTTTGCTAFTVHTGGDEAGLCELFQDCASQPASNVITGFTFVANSNAKTCTTSTGIGTCYDWDGTQTGSVTAVTSTDCGVGKRPGEAAVASSFFLRRQSRRQALRLLFAKILRAAAQTTLQRAATTFCAATKMVAVVGR